MLYLITYIQGDDFMTVILFVDDSGGMMFNRRRQSRDKVALQKIVDMTSDSTLWVNEYSAPLFTEFNVPQLRVDSDFLSKAGKGEFCFVENVDIMPFLPFIEKIVQFHWNRAYPSDLNFPIDLHNGRWMLLSTEDFAGSSHAKIAMEVFAK